MLAWHNPSAECTLNDSIRKYKLADKGWLTRLFVHSGIAIYLHGFEAASFVVAFN